MDARLARRAALAAAIGLWAPGLWAQSAWDGDFTFRMVGVPEPGDRNRITVQVAPAAPAAPSGPPVAGTPRSSSLSGAATTPPARRAAAYDWFWDAVAPGIEASGPGRLTPALAVLSSGPSGRKVQTPRLQHMQGLAEAYGRDILRETVGTSVSPALVLAVMSVESAGRVDAVSSAGAQGLMQLMPATAERFGVTDRLDPAQNIAGGVAYLDWLMGHFENDPILVLAGYNAGEGAVRDNEGVPPFAETRDYVPKVLAAWTVARGLCLTPPELVSDGCVFAAGRG